MNILFFFIITQLYIYNSYDFIECTEQVLRTKQNINLLSIKPLNYFYDTHQYLGYNFSTAFRTYLDNDVFLTQLDFQFMEKNLLMNIEGVLKAGDSTSSLYPTRKWNDKAASDYTRAFVAYGNKKVGLMLGREKLTIGPSPRYNALLSGYAPSMDGLFYWYRNKFFNIYFWGAKLETSLQKKLEYVGDTITEVIRASRYFSLHRIETAIWQNFSLGFQEVVLYGGENRDFEPHYFNPLVLYYVYQFNRSTDDNYFWDFDVKCYLGNVYLYAEAMFDDFQYAEDPQGEPNHYVLNLGSMIIDPVGNKNSMLFVEYTRASRWVYNHFVPWQRYTYLGFPIGHPYGCSFDDFYMLYRIKLLKNLDLYSSLEYRRKGETEIDTPWPVPEPRSVDPEAKFPSNNFLSGVVEKMYKFEERIKFKIKQWNVDLSVGLEMYKNYKHAENNDCKNLVFSIYLKRDYSLKF